MLKVVFILSIIIASVTSQVPSGKAINTCGYMNYNVPTQKSDCIDHKEGVNCCYTQVTTNDGTKAFCAIIPGSLDDEIYQEIKDIVGASQLTIECNTSKYLSLSLVFATFIVGLLL